MFWKIHFLLSVCFGGPAPVDYGDPDPVDDNYPSVHEIREDAIHNEEIPHSSSSAGASCFSSVQERYHALMSMLLVARQVLVVKHVWWWRGMEENPESKSSQDIKRSDI